jgi:hypothetical protein
LSKRFLFGFSDIYFLPHKRRKEDFQTTMMTSGKSRRLLRKDMIAFSHALFAMHRQRFGPVLSGDNETAIDVLLCAERPNLPPNCIFVPSLLSRMAEDLAQLDTTAFTVDFGANL